jgi:hypothetical protein
MPDPRKHFRNFFEALANFVKKRRNPLVTSLNVVKAHDNTPDVTLHGAGACGVMQRVGLYANDVQHWCGSA